MNIFQNYKTFGETGKVELDLNNYATKADLKSATGADTSNFAKKTVLANLKSDADKLDIDKLKNAPSSISNLKSKVDKLDVDKLVLVAVDLSKLSDVVKMMTEYNVLLNKVNNINITDTSNLVKKTDSNTKINKIGKKSTDHSHSNKYITAQEFKIFCCKIRKSKFSKQK